MLLQVIEQRRKNLGDFEVGRVLPSAAQRMVGPFVFFDHFGPVDLAAGLSKSADVRPHPHIGLSTVTYLFDGEIVHRDSVGSTLPIHPGEVNWMVAGSGITHSERFEKARAQGDSLHGIQSWVALPAKDEEVTPSFAHYDSSSLPEQGDSNIWMRVIAGESHGLRSPVTVHSPQFYVHVRLAAGATLQLPDQYSERAAYVASGEVEADNARFHVGQMLIFKPGQAAIVKATTAATLMLLGGEPIGPRYLEWNFVSSSRERIEQAKADWRAGRMKLPDADHDEFIPLPDTDASHRNG
ncbi:MAG: pirin family protein [Pseudomonadota bacterium]